MNKIIVFKPEFEAKLKKLKIKTKFVNNIKAYTKQQNTSTIEDVLKYLHAESLWRWFICTAFNWKDTPEGHDYWFNISNL